MATHYEVAARGLLRRYGDLEALRGLDLHLEKGEFLGLLGPNGAGKTTSLRLISCLESRDGGDLEVLGNDPESGRAVILDRLGVVPQELAIYDGLTALENLNFFAAMHGLTGAKARERVAWALEASG
ncbi:MAG: ATP-binding cassette domain-containing protein, partial [Planctomycetes bacterium]|nr:ATP-binding cassette domain-containing protein [Planctomycetota bacterium]